MLNYRLGTVNENHWGFKPVFRCNKPHTFSTLSREEKRKKTVHSFFSTMPLGNSTKRQESKQTQNQNKEGLKKRKSPVQKVSCL